MHTKEDFIEHVIGFSSRPRPDGSSVILFVCAAGCIKSTHLGGMLDKAVREHPAALRLAKVDIGVMASEVGIPEILEEGTPQTLIFHGGKAISHFKGWHGNEQLAKVLQMVADLNDRV